MTVRIEPNRYKRQLQADLATLMGGATQWSVDLNGIVSVVNPTTRAGQLLYALTTSSVGVLLVGDEGASKFVLQGQTFELRGVGGVTQANANPPANIVVGYDVTSCYGRGYQVRGTDAALIPFPGPILLGHELAHAAQMASGQFTTVPAGELFAVTEENVFRQVSKLPARDTSSFATMTDGGCGPVREKKSEPVRSGSGCFVATAAHGSELHPFVQELREFRDEVLRSTTYGRQFWDEFYAFYERVSRPW